MLRYRGKQGAEVREGCVPPSCRFSGQAGIKHKSQAAACSRMHATSLPSCLAAWQRRSISRNPAHERYHLQDEGFFTVPIPVRRYRHDWWNPAPDNFSASTPDGRQEERVGNPGKKHAFFLESWGRRNKCPQLLHCGDQTPRFAEGPGQITRPVSWRCISCRLVRGRPEESD